MWKIMIRAKGIVAASISVGDRPNGRRFIDWTSEIGTFVTIRLCGKRQSERRPIGNARIIWIPDRSDPRRDSFNVSQRTRAADRGRGPIDSARVPIRHLAFRRGCVIPRSNSPSPKSKYFNSHLGSFVFSNYILGPVLFSPNRVTFSAIKSGQVIRREGGER